MKININDIEVEILEVTTKDSREREFVKRYIIKYGVMIDHNHTITGEFTTGILDKELVLIERILKELRQAFGLNKYNR